MIVFELFGDYINDYMAENATELLQNIFDDDEGLRDLMGFC